MNGGGEGVRVFAQPVWLRAVNVPAAAGLGLLVALVADEASGNLPVPWVALLAGGGGLLGLLVARSQVTVTRTHIEYRGMFATRCIALSAVLELSDNRDHWTSWLATVPELRYGDRGSPGTLRLWCLAMADHHAIGARHTARVVAELADEVDRIRTAQRSG